MAAQGHRPRAPLRLKAPRAASYTTRWGTNHVDQRSLGGADLGRERACAELVMVLEATNMETTIRRAHPGKVQALRGGKADGDGVEPVHVPIDQE